MLVSHERLPLKESILQRNNGSLILRLFLPENIHPDSRGTEHLGQKYSTVKFVSKLRLQFLLKVFATTSYQKPTQKFHETIQLKIVQRPHLQRFGGLYPYCEQTLCFPKRAIRN